MPVGWLTLELASEPYAAFWVRDRMIDYVLKYKSTARGLDIIQTVFAVVMALGIREVFVGSHTFITDVIFGTNKSATGIRLIAAALFLNVILLGMRFFWVPRNLRRVLYVAALFSEKEPAIRRMPSWFISFNWLVIFVHAGMYYIVCTEFKYSMFLLSSSSASYTSMFSGYFLGHALLLAINGIWIAMLTRYEAPLLDELGMARAPGDVSPGVIWFRNNLVSSLIALAPLALTERCLTTVHECIRAQGSGLDGVSQFLPTSPTLLTSVYGFARWAGALGDDPALALAAWILVCFLWNSALDLYSTGHYYVVLEEIEWEGKKSGSNEAPPPAPTAQPAKADTSVVDTSKPGSSST